MGYTIGDRLPDPLYLRALDAEIAVPYVRECQECKFQWATVEIPLVAEWMGRKATNCPVHKKKYGRKVKSYYPGAPENPNPKSRGMVLAVEIGGYYRRRKCLHADCLLRGPKGVRWTTLEVQAGGMINAGIYWCPKCGKPSRIVKGARSGVRKHRPKWYVRGGYKYAHY